MARTKEKAPAKERAKAFLKAYADTCNIRAAARKSKVTRQAHYRWMRQYPDSYGAVFKRAREHAGDYLESVAVERATTGWKEPIYYQGDICGHVTRYDGGLLQFLLRGLKPDVYGVQRQELSGPDKAPIQAKIEIVFVRPGDNPGSPPQ